MSYRLFVMDSSPLVTLAYGQALDAVLAVKLPIFIPDMVFYEVTGHAGKPGADEVLSWAKRSVGRVTILPTETFQEYLTLKSIKPQIKMRDREEISAFEVIRDYLRDESERAFLLYEDRDVARMGAGRETGRNISLLTTGGLLRLVEEETHVIKAAEVLEKAMRARENAERQMQDGRAP